jgi:hypothetical protein
MGSIIIKKAYTKGGNVESVRYWNHTKPVQRLFVGLSAGFQSEQDVNGILENTFDGVSNLLWAISPIPLA